MPQDVQDQILDLMIKLKCKPIVVASHPRSGTHLMIDCLRNNFKECRSWKLFGQKTDALYLDIDRIVSASRRLTPEEAIRPLYRTKRPILKTHAEGDFNHVFVGRHDPFSPRLISWLKENANFIYMHRDGRQSLSSGFIHWGSRKACSTLGDYMRQPDENQSSRAAAWANHVRGWLAFSGVCRISMEELLSNPDTVLGEMASQFGLSGPHGRYRLPKIRDRRTLTRLMNVLAMRTESTAVLLTEKPHDWRELLTADDRAAFHRDAGDVLMKLGYERSDQWIREALQSATEPTLEITSKQVVSVA